MTNAQLHRAARRLWRDLRDRSGYQPWGYDIRTLAIVEPGFMAAMRRLQAIQGSNNNKTEA